MKSDIKGETMGKESKARDTNIELLRIISMMMVLILHALGWSGALGYLSGLKFFAYWWMEALSIVAVDVFVLISGYFLIESKFNSKKVFQTAVGGVWIYSVIFGLVAMNVSGDGIALGTLIKCFFPIITKKFWFVNSYIALYIFSPFINKLIHSLSKKQFTFLVGMMIAVFSIRTTVFPLSWSQDATGGYGIISFVMLYCVAAWVRLYYKSDGKYGLWLMLYFCMTFLLVMSKFCILKLGIGVDYSSKFYVYASPVVVIEAVALLLFFLNLKRIQNNKINSVINVLSKHSFSVYIIHFTMLGVLFTKIIPLNRVVDNVGIGVLAVLATVILIYICCVAIDIVKCYIFSKVGMRLKGTGVDKAYTWICEKWDDFSQGDEQQKNVLCEEK